MSTKNISLIQQLLGVAVLGKVKELPQSIETAMDIYLKWHTNKWLKDYKGQMPTKDTPVVLTGGQLNYGGGVFGFRVSLVLDSNNQAQYSFSSCVTGKLKKLQDAPINIFTLAFLYANLPIIPGESCPNLSRLQRVSQIQDKAYKGATLIDR